MVPYNSLRITKGAQRKQGQEWYPVFTMETLKNATLPYRAEHNSLAHIQEYLPPGKNIKDNEAGILIWNTLVCLNKIVCASVGAVGMVKGLDNCLSKRFLTDLTIV